MKKYILIIFLATSVPVFTTACDICGCGVGNSYIGILPDFYKHIFGFRYRYNSMFTHVGVGGSFSYLTTKETYNTIEAWSGRNIGKKFRVMASVPYSFNEKTNQGITNNKNGIGDISLSGYYQLLNKRQPFPGNKLLVQSLYIGAGIKSATGKYNPLDKTSTNDNANLFQLGTGSTDFNFSAMYDVRLQDMGINLSSNYKITTANKYHYEYGNKFSINAQAYYKFKINKKLSVAPNAGIQYEKTKDDLDNGFDVTVSGGRLLLGTVGVETAFSKFAVGANFQTPLSQNLASGIVKANNRFMLHMAIAL
ncbi:MAG: transporter [Ferruginibacter sp.]